MYLSLRRERVLLIGMEFTPEAGGARRFAERLAEEGLSCEEVRKHVVRFAPLLIIKREKVDWALARLRKILQQ